MRVLKRYYGKNENLNKLLPILLEKTNISLRILDHFITNYAKNKKVVYYLDSNNNIINNLKDRKFAQSFIVYLHYKSQLKSFKKDRFDPFRRGDRISFCYDITSDNYIETTVGQLNFFKWAIDNKVLDYVIEHLEEIEDDMNKFTNRSGRRRRNTRRRIELNTDKVKSISNNDDDNIKIDIKIDNKTDLQKQINSISKLPLTAHKIETDKYTKIIVKFD